MKTVDLIKLYGLSFKVLRMWEEDEGRITWRTHFDLLLVRSNELEDGASIILRDYSPGWTHSVEDTQKVLTELLSIQAGYACHLGYEDNYGDYEDVDPWLVGIIEMAMNFRNFLGAEAWADLIYLED